MGMGKSVRSITTFFYTKFYVVIYGLLLLIFSQYVPIHPNMYILIFSQGITSYLTSSIFEIISMVEKYIVIIILMLPLISIEIARTLSCRKLNILLLEVVILLLTTGNIVFAVVYIILTIILIKFLKIFFYIENEYREKSDKEDKNKQCRIAETISNNKIGRAQKYAMMFISIGTAIFTYIILTVIFRANIFLISILVYIVAIVIVYTHNHHCYKSVNISILFKQAILIGIPPYGVISYIQC